MVNETDIKELQLAHWLSVAKAMSGLSLQEISEELGISMSTLSSYTRKNRKIKYRGADWWKIVKFCQEQHEEYINWYERGI